jgi:hypothetical protein
MLMVASLPLSLSASMETSSICALVSSAPIALIRTQISFTSGIGQPSSRRRAGGNERVDAFGEDGEIAQPKIIDLSGAEVAEPGQREQVAGADPGDAFG